jgi:hypothetical protein
MSGEGGPQPESEHLVLVHDGHPDGGVGVDGRGFHRSELFKSFTWQLLPQQKLGQQLPRFKWKSTGPI